MGLTLGVAMGSVWKVRYVRSHPSVGVGVGVGVTRQQTIDWMGQGEGAPGGVGAGARAVPLRGWLRPRRGKGSSRLHPVWLRQRWRVSFVQSGVRLI